MKVTAIVLCGLVLGSFVSAKSELNLVQLKAAHFLYNKAVKQTAKSELSKKKNNLWKQDIICDQPSSIDGQCVKFVAGDYPSSDERVNAARACAGVQSVECVKFVAGNYPNSDERVNAAKTCAGVVDVECIKFVAGNYPNSDERNEAVLACKYASVDCVKEVAGNYPNFSERVAAAKACGGQ